MRSAEDAAPIAWPMVRNGDPDEVPAFESDPVVETYQVAIQASLMRVPRGVHIARPWSGCISDRRACDRIIHGRPLEDAVQEELERSRGRSEADRERRIHSVDRPG